MRRTLALATALVLAALVTAGLTTGCTPTLPDADPDIAGVVMNLSDVNDGVAVLVETSGQVLYAYDIASAFIGSDTTVLVDEPDGLARATYEEVFRGALVEVWFEGPVAESYPVQATAGTVVIRGVAE